MRNNVAIKLNYITEEEKYETLKRNFAQERAKTKAKAKKKPVSEIVTGIVLIILSIVSIPILEGDATFAFLMFFFAIGVLFGKEDEEYNE